MKIALLGNQNSGKTTLFNLLTGTNQKVGNWPGVTIERKSGYIKGTNHELIDLPGIYSLSPYTQEEVISRDFVVNEKIDLIINLVDATNIERSLYLTTQLLELDTKVIVALNMADELEKKGIHIDVEKLSDLLNTDVLKISALKNMGIDVLIDLIKKVNTKKNEHVKIYSNDVENFLSKLILESNHKRFIGVKVFEKDEKYSFLITAALDEQIKQIEDVYGYDVEEIIANQRYEYIVKVKEQAITCDAIKETITDRLDKVLLNKYAAIPIFVVIMFCIYYLSVGVVGSWTVDLISGFIDKLSDLVGSWLTTKNASGWAISLVCDGIIAGVGAVLNFIPQLIILFICISILETSGYMSRIAFFLDRIFRKFGLSGKSLIPFIVGSGCTVPGIMTARTVEDDAERHITIMCTPFIPCSAKLPIIALFGSAFFPVHSGLITVSLYFMAIVIILVSAIVMNKFFIKGNHTSFISELPEYRLPSFKYVFRDVFEKTVSFFKRAGTVILLCSVIMWVLLSFTWKAEYIEVECNNQLEYVNLELIADKYNIDLNDDTIKVTTSFDQKGLLYVTFGKLENDEYVYTENILIPGITKTDIDHLTNNDDSRKTLIMKVVDGKVYYGYSLTVENSILASIGRTFAWIFYPIVGELNWGVTVSAVQGLVAKEQVVSSMSIIAGFDEEANSNMIFDSKMFGNITGLSGYAFMVFNLFCAPCFGAIGAMKKELGSTRKMFKAISFQTGLAWLLASLIFGIGRIISLI